MPLRNSRSMPKNQEEMDNELKNRVTLLKAFVSEIAQAILGNDVFFQGHCSS